MPRVLSYTPPWLSSPSRGFDLFAQPRHKNKARNINGASGSVASVGPYRTIAHRGTEVFVVVENEIRWSDLVLLKEKGTSDEELRRSRSSRRRGSGSPEDTANQDDLEVSSYRVSHALGPSSKQGADQF